MAYSSIVKPTDYFNTVLYTGNGGSQSITGVGFQPDWIWLKRRDGSASHRLVDSVRGTQKRLSSDSTNAQSTETGLVTSFDSDGFALNSSDVAFNGSSNTYVSWNWLASGSTASNGNGSITSTVSANTTAGFSIVSYTGTGSNATIGHGLGAIPKMYIARNITDAEQWTTYHVGLDASAPEDYHVRLNTTDARVDEASVWNDTAPTSSVFSVGDSGAPNGNGDSHIAYCFAEVKGFSKFESYTGNGNSNGPFIYTGFRPAWVLVKRTNSAGNNWQLHDIERTQYTQPINHRIAPNVSLAEQTGDTLGFDFLSNGFRPNNTNSDYNNDGSTYIYMAFAEHPFVANDSGTAVPVTAR